MTTINVPGKNIELREFAEQDAAQLYGVIDSNREHLKEWLFWVDFTTEIASSVGFIQAVIESNSAKQSLVLGIWRGHELLGAISLVDINYETKIAQLGYWISEAEQGKGYITAACKALITHAFENFEIEQIHVRCIAENERSHAVIKRLGLSCSTIIDGPQWTHGAQSVEPVPITCGQTSRLTWELLRQTRNSPTMFAAANLQVLPSDRVLGEVDETILSGAASNQSSISNSISGGML